MPLHINTASRRVCSGRFILAQLPLATLTPDQVQPTSRHVVRCGPRRLTEESKIPSRFSSLEASIPPSRVFGTCVIMFGPRIMHTMVSWHNCMLLRCSLVR